MFFSCMFCNIFNEVILSSIFVIKQKVQCCLSRRVCFWVWGSAEVFPPRVTRKVARGQVLLGYHLTMCTDILGVGGRDWLYGSSL